MRTHAIIILGALAAFTAVGAITGTITMENGEKYRGAVRWSNREKAYLLKEGKIERTIKENETAGIDIEKPDGFDAVVAQVESGQADAAIPALQKIVKDYAHLQWDMIAGRYLAEAYIAADKPSEAKKVCDEIIKDEPTAQYRGDLAPAYWSALLSLTQRSSLEKCLEKAEKGDDRFSRGAALIMRGNIALKDGKETAEACRKALTDGYLRVILLYKNVEGAEKLQPEALFRAAYCFEKLGQSVRADFMRTELKSSYASSPWAKK